MKKLFASLVWMVVVGAVSGCTPAVVQVQPSYTAMKSFTGGKGTVYLTVKVDRQPGRRTESGEWITGSIRDGKGNEIGKVVTTSPAEEIVLSAFADELEASGYRVEKVAPIPADAAKGVDFTTITMSVNEKTAVATWEAEAKLQVEYDLVRNGKSVMRQSYQTSYMRTGMRGDPNLPTRVFLEAVREAVRQGVPVMIKELEKGS